MKILQYFIDYVIPPRCLSCCALVISDNSFCADCWIKLNFITKPYCKLCGRKLNISVVTDELMCSKCIQNKPHFHFARSLFKFDENSKKLIHKFKYHDQTTMAKTFAKLLYQRYHRQIDKNIDVIVPVPMHKIKRLMRMYNQSSVLADALARFLQKPVNHNILIKSKWTKPQVMLSKSAREKNLIKSLQFNTKYNVHNKKVLLIDDVATTGSTINQCSNILKTAGADTIYCLTIAAT